MKQSLELQSYCNRISSKVTRLLSVLTLSCLTSVECLWTFQTIFLSSWDRLNANMGNKSPPDSTS
jgi:hypothetical protein